MTIIAFNVIYIVNITWSKLSINWLSKKQIQNNVKFLVEFSDKKKSNSRVVLVNFAGTLQKKLTKKRDPRNTMKTSINYGI